jgi:RimJ/RimL family protein N-acetyltransferase
MKHAMTKEHKNNMVKPNGQSVVKQFNKSKHKNNQFNFFSDSNPENISPLIAAHWAELIIHYWKECAARGELDRTYPLEILDFMPGSGGMIGLLLHALDEKLAVEPDFEFKYRYLPVISSRDYFHRIHNQIELSHFFKIQKIIPLYWNGKSHEACLLRQNAREKWKPVNPAVILMHDLWGKLPQRLLAVHYGEIFEANIPLLIADKSTQGSEIWKNIHHNHELCEVLNEADQYVTRLNSTPIPYPELVFNLLQAVHDLVSVPNFMISAAAGYANQHSLRSKSFADIAHYLENHRETLTLPVNFHLIENQHRKLQGFSKQIELQGCSVLQLALYGHHDANSRLNRLSNLVNTAIFQEVDTITQAMRAVDQYANLDHRLNLLRISHYDPKIFFLNFPELIIAIKKNPYLNQVAWHETLEKIWNNIFSEIYDRSIFEKLAMTAMHCGHWKLARIALHRGIELYGNTPEYLAYLVWCDARTGRIEKAWKDLQSAIREYPNNKLILEIQQRLSQRLQHWNNSWHITLRHASLPISLEPLDDSHAENLLHQYRDRQIAIMTGLPILQTIEQVHQWINEHRLDPGRVDFAVMHDDFGFVGYVNLAVSQHAAYFCFWAGLDFQGKGYATEAGKLVIEYAHTQGVDVILTSAYRDNARSIRSLNKLGFLEIAAYADAPDDDRIFYYVPEKLSSKNRNMVDELMGYYKRENLQMTILPKVMLHDDMVL